MELVRTLAGKRRIIITGHYGSGKTEFAVNLALALAGIGCKTALADLDIVNPYFRSRERRDMLERRNVRLIATSQACTDADVPALPADIFTTFEDPDLVSVYDVGGDPAGARVLARFAPQINALDHEMLCVVNANRPQTATAQAASAYLRAIETVSGVAVTALVDNTHLCGETGERDLQKGRELIRQVSELTGLPVLCHAVERRMADGSADQFPMDIYMKKPWE
ncbi:hypothetical protein H8790_09060 [Oscillibacter hominis]|mgnify:CR=1 FL=1|uniref:CobQ/CobB/MinD/ParA nucleotide binding domain-containing protein n=1 Tax=Oscillibacter hominis TaxID=2763056 RepID=A0A7G9B241_9FIRM|nr:hypothetical protein [Oscillibacter hominis]QNL43622.1 hypothetical protein H8790_09060 [Oscillibacter hominis]